MILMVLFRVVVIVFFIYIIWRKLVGEYKVNDLLLYIWSSLLFFVVGGRLVHGLLNWGVWENLIDWVLIWRVAGISYWGGIAAVVGWTYYFCTVKNWKFLILAEEMTPFFLVLTSGMLTADFLWGGWQFDTLGWGVIGIIVLLIVLILKDKYRSFVWYSSGKKGFVFWSGLFFYSILSIFWLLFIKAENGWLAVAGGMCLTSAVGLFILGDTLKFLSINIGGKKK